MTIYEINEAITALVDPESGELLDYEAFEQLQMERESKLENMALWVKDLQAEAKAIREEEKALAERRRAAQNKAESLSAYLQQMLDGEKFKTARCSISYRSTQSVDITDQLALMSWAEKNGHEDSIFTYDVKVSKTAIKDIIKAGETPDGAELITNTNMIIK